MGFDLLTLEMIPKPQHSDLEVSVVLTEPVYQLVNSFQLSRVLIYLMARFEFTAWDAVIQIKHSAWSAGKTFSVQWDE